MKEIQKERESERERGYQKGGLAFAPTTTRVEWPLCCVYMVCVCVFTTHEVIIELNSFALQLAGNPRNVSMESELGGKIMSTVGFVFFDYSVDKIKCVGWFIETLEKVECVNLLYAVQITVNAENTENRDVNIKRTVHIFFVRTLI